ncbi:hypothetical protein BGX29_003505, partial [Mortierella sp. GBA35]
MSSSSRLFTTPSKPAQSSASTLTISATSKTLEFARYAYHIRSLEASIIEVAYIFNSMLDFLDTHQAITPTPSIAVRRPRRLPLPDPRIRFM